MLKDSYSNDEPRVLTAVDRENYSETERNGEKIIGEGVKFQRVRRITGYLVGTIDRFNNAKKAEVFDRVPHM